MESSITHTLETFFPVSIRKLILMSLCTFGFYQIFWLYQNWRIVKYRDRRKISPPWRSVLGLLFLYPIFRRVQRQGRLLGFGALPAVALFASWLLLNLMSYAPSPLVTVLSFGSVLALVPVQRKANSINQATNPDLPKNDKFGVLNWVALVIGGPMAVLSAIGIIIQGVQT